MLFYTKFIVKNEVILFDIKFELLTWIIIIQHLGLYINLKFMTVKIWWIEKLERT